MTTVRRYGFFGELSPEEQLHVICELRSPFSDVNEPLILGYLAHGVPVGFTPGVEEDPLSTPRRIIGPPNPLTDGVWCWPETLAYYLREYHLRLPAEFVAHMERMGWTVPSSVDISTIDLGGDKIA